MDIEHEKIWANKVLTPEGWAKNRLISVENGRISAIDSCDSCPDEAVSVPILTPGLFDIHNHGGEGFDLGSLDMDALAVFLEASRRAGVTDILLTLLTGSLENMAKQLVFIRSAMELQAQGKLGGTHICGAHLEGPFLSPVRAGAQETDQILLPSTELYDRYLGSFDDVIRLVTVAPEREGAFELAAHLRGQGICVQAGHTDCPAECAAAAFENGFDSVCHTFNACPPIHHRAPGLVTEALICDSVYCEAICDLTHLHPSILKLLYKCKGPDRMVVISDSTMPKGLPDGRYFYANSWVIVKNGERRCENGALNGGLCYLDGSVRNLISIGIPQEDAFVMASRTPARRLGMSDRGTLEVGKAANLTGFSEDFRPILTIISGKIEKIG